MSDAAIKHVLFHESAAIAGVLREQIATEPNPLIQANAVDVIGRAAYQVGLEIGLSIAIADVAAARQLQEWLARNVQGGDPRALKARDRQAANYLRVLLR